MEYNCKTENYFNILAKEYVNNGEITWEEFNKDQKNKGQVVLVLKKF